VRLDIQWAKPIPLLDGDKQNLIYTADGLDDWWDTPGVYLFAKMYGDKVTPLYVGKATNIAKRARQHFKTSTQLMNAIRKSGNGAKVFIPGEFTAKQGQDQAKSLDIVERGLINHLLAEGFELLNVQGTKTPSHHIDFSGYLGARNLTGKFMSVRKRR
jgi:hypothetical protein